MSPNAGGGGELRGLSQRVQLNRSPNKLWKCNSMFSLWADYFVVKSECRAARESGISVTYSPRHRRPRPFADAPTVFKGTVA
jgi:hypothetical protein